MKKIVMTGGGTAGHVTPNIALMPALKEAGYEISYIGSYSGMEKELIEAQNIPYYGISSGKLRRYFDLKNFSDPFKVLKGYGQAISLLKKLKPDVVLYEEPLDDDVVRRAIDYIRKAEVLIIGGTSLNVYPAAGLINYYKGDKLVLVNLSETPYDNYADLVIHEKIGEVFSQI